jgi:hypothetical protein
MPEDDYQLFMLLVRNPKSWTGPETAYVCQSFIRLLEDENLPLSPLLTTRLWRYWFLVHGETPLMPEPRHNLALMLAAQAFGEFVPGADANDFFGRYRKNLATEEARLAKDKLFWGPRACLDNSDPALDSSVSSVCILQEKDQIQEIALIGQNIPGIRQELFDAFFSCALRIQSGNLDKVNLGAFQLSALTGEQDTLDLPGLSSSGSASFSAQTKDQSPSDLLEELARQCKSLQEHTEFVTVWEGEACLKSSFDQELRSHVQSCFQTKTVKIIAPDPRLSPEGKGLLTYVPYYLFGNRPRPLRLVLPPEIIQQASFTELLDEFKYHMVERIIADAEIRLASYEKHVRDLQEELKRWNVTPAGLRHEIWGETVTVSEKFIIETGTTVRLTQPRQISVEEYIRENIPSLISHYQNWAERMKKIIQEIRNATEGADNPARRLAVSLFIDIALRERPDYFESRKLRERFEKWHTQVGPFLRYKWRAALRARGIAAGDIFNRHTVFHTRFQTDEDGNLVALVVQPFAAVAPMASILVLDPQMPVMRVVAPVSFAETAPSTSDQTPRDPWSSFKPLFTNLDPGNADQVANLQQSIHEHAAELLPYLVQVLANNRETGAGIFGSQEQMIRTTEELIKKNRLASFGTVVSSLLFGQGAYQSARELCRSVNVPPELKVRVLLWQAVIECRAHGYSPTELIPKLLNTSKPISTLQTENNLIFTLLDDARRLDPSYVQQWKEKLKNAKELNRALNFLERDWPRTDASLSSLEKVALWKATVGVEMLRLSRRLNNAAKEIRDDGENAITLLAKLGEPLEEIMSSEMSLSSLSDVYSLMEILLGQEKPAQSMGSES